jgi:hypothetical protein
MSATEWPAKPGKRSLVRYLIEEGGRCARLKLIRPLGKKRNWWLGWNGERLAKNRDAVLLFKHEPEIYQWVINILPAHGEFHVKPIKEA